MQTWSVREIPQSQYMQIATIAIYQNQLRYTKSQSGYKQYVNRGIKTRLLRGIDNN